eukprot:c17982_g1_i2.p1 GENE.c17982_g1_i2~~c17982_g1_i2.p1  ORF type:complete len:186 (+),score=61.19 c17982_g1_i2:31-588(+)
MGRIKRRRTTPKVSQKPKPTPSSFEDPSIKIKYNPFKTVRQNFREAGLAYKLNEDYVAPEEKKIKPTTKEVLDVPEEVHVERDLRAGEKKFVFRCIQKYGDNYTKMQFDSQLNMRQLTGAQIRKLCLRYQGLYKKTQDDEEKKAIAEKKAKKLQNKMRRKQEFLKRQAKAKEEAKSKEEVEKSEE